MNGATLRLAWSNLWRQRRRTQLLLVVVAYATVAIIFFWGFFDGFVDSLLSSQARYLSAPVTIMRPAYLEDPDPENHLPAGDWASAVADADGVDAVSPRLEVPALVRSPYTSVGMTLRGVDPAAEGRVSLVPGDVHDGRILAGPGEIVLGRAVAEELDVRLGERVAVDAQGLAGPASLGLRLVGIVDSGIAAVDRTAALITLPDAAVLAGEEQPTTLALDVAPGAEQRVARALDASGLLPQGVRAFDVEATLAGVLQGISAKRQVMVPMVLIFALFAAIAVISTVVVSVLERWREFGVIASLGLEPGRLAAMVALEAVLTSGLGFAIGAVLGFGLNTLLSRVDVLGPVLVRFYGPILKDIALTGDIYVAISAAYLLWAGSTIALAALFALLAPARRVRRLNPSEAMRAA